MKKLLLFFLACTFGLTAAGQNFYFGNDLSYANQMEDCGAVFKEAGQPKDVYKIFADQGTNLVRVRLWVDPTWQNSLEQPAGVKPQYSNFEDVKETIARAKGAGMQVMLDLHYSDIWADPGRQLIPSRWLHLANDTEALKQAVYDYTVEVLQTLDREGLMPHIVKVGNETNGGILYHTSTDANHDATGSVSANWTRHAALFNAGIRAVRAVGATASINPKIALHYSGLRNLKSWYQNVINNGVTDFDIIGFSYYYSWHGGSIATLGQTVQDLVTSFPGYEVAVVETGYLWTTENFDTNGNIINTPDPAYLPVSPEKQLQYMVDFTRQVKSSGGTGVIFWEPAWVSTPCRTPWGQGSSHDHVAFFDPKTYNFMENGGGRWTNPGFYQEQPAKLVTFKVDMTGADASKGVFVTGDFAGAAWQLQPMTHEGNNIYSWSTVQPATATGAYYFLNGPDWANRETVPAACAAMWNKDRGYDISKSTSYAFKWASCEPIAGPPEPEKVQVIFKVDMTGADASKGVFVTGSFNDAAWKLNPMTHIGNNIYSWSTTVSATAAEAYYFLNGPNWTDREKVPAECATWWNTDRGYDITKSKEYAFKWASCEAITAPEEPENVQVTFKVDMTGADASKGVFVTGSFDGTTWQIRPMTLEGNNIYTWSTTLPATATGAFYFLNGPEWANRETVPAACATMWNVDRGYDIAKSTEYAFKWASCEAIAPPAEPEPEKVQVTFKVDMTGADASKGVFVTGDFDGTAWQLRPMTNIGNNIYSWSTTLPATATGAYYFLNGPDWANRETVPAECATMWNKDRGFDIAKSKEYAFKWAFCEPIEDKQEPSNVAITFKVDMKGAGVNISKGIYLVGKVNDSTFTRMTHEGNLIYSATLDLKPGEILAYYYTTNDSRKNHRQYRETVPAACAESNEIDRLLVVPAEAATVGFKWSSCEPIKSPLSSKPGKKEPRTESVYEGTVSVYPNPSNGQVTINLQQYSEGLKLVVLNGAGQQVLLRDKLSTDSSGQLSAGLTDLPAGLYLIRVFGDGRSIVNQKIIIQK